MFREKINLVQLTKVRNIKRKRGFICLESVYSVRGT